MANDKPLLKRQRTYEQKSNTLKLPQFNINNIPPIPTNTALLIVAVIALLITMILTVNIHDNNNITENTTPTGTVTPTIVLGNSSYGNVIKEGPYGNVDSDVKIAYILGVHPREKGAHKLLEQAFNDKKNNLSYCYYIYKINVTEDSKDFSQSRSNGQQLAYDYAVPDMIENNFTFAVDSHYSNGHWGVTRFIFTPRENNILSSELGHAMAENFEWLTYYTPYDPTSPDYVTGPLNDGGVAAVIYEAYTEDENSTTLEHNRELISFIDGWNFNK